MIAAVYQETNGLLDMRILDSTLGDRIAQYALGLIVLQTDETVEPELQRLFSALDVALYVSRIPSAADVTPETLAAMEPALLASASLLPPSIAFDAVGYACTSGATVIGPERVEELVSGGCRASRVTNPLTALLAACKRLAVRRLGFVTPYRFDVSNTMRETLESRGLEIAGAGTFNIEIEEKVARISPTSIKDAARSVAHAEPCDAVFLSCTNLVTLEIIEAIEEELNLPVLTSNQVLAWHLLELAGIDTEVSGYGRLFSETKSRP